MQISKDYIKETGNRKFCLNIMIFLWFDDGWIALRAQKQPRIEKAETLWKYNLKTMSFSLLFNCFLFYHLRICCLHFFFTLHRQGFAHIFGGISFSLVIENLHPRQVPFWLKFVSAALISLSYLLRRGRLKQEVTVGDLGRRLIQEPDKALVEQFHCVGSCSTVINSIAPHKDWSSAIVQN